MTPREELVASIRGRYLVPVIVTLAELGLLQKLLSGPFFLRDFCEVKGQAAFAAVVDYLVSIGVCMPTDIDGQFTVTGTGRTILSRAGAHLILESYGDLFSNLRGLLDAGKSPPPVDRDRNIHGSGLIHKKKFFPAAIEMLEAERCSQLIDLGCGNGEFLSQVRQRLPNCRLTGVDLSPTAIEETRSRIACEQVSVCCASADAIDSWSTRFEYDSGTVVAMWFVLHEFVDSAPSRAIDFFRRLAAKLPDADVLIGEIVAVDPASLAAAHSETVVPEFLLFHQLSGQGVLSADAWNEIKSSIPYEIRHEISTSQIQDSSGTEHPCSFIWYLRPHRVN